MPPLGGLDSCGKYPATRQPEENQRCKWAGSLWAFLQWVSEPSVMGSSADAKAWAFVSVPLPTASTPPGFFSLLRCRQSLLPFLCISCAACVCLWHSGGCFSVASSTTTWRHIRGRESQGRKSRGILGKLIPRGQQQWRDLFAGLEGGNGDRGVFPV